MVKIKNMNDKTELYKIKQMLIELSDIIDTWEYTLEEPAPKAQKIITEIYDKIHKLTKKEL